LEKLTASRHLAATATPKVKGLVLMLVTSSAGTTKKGRKDFSVFWRIDITTGTSNLTNFDFHMR